MSRKKLVVDENGKMKRVAIKEDGEMKESKEVKKDSNKKKTSGGKK